MMSAPTPMGSPGRDPAQLQLARDMVLPALCQAFGAALARFDDALFDRAGNAGSSQLLFLDAMRELRRRRGTLPVPSLATCSGPGMRWPVVSPCRPNRRCPAQPRMA